MELPPTPRFLRAPSVGALIRWGAVGLLTLNACSGKTEDSSSSVGLPDETAEIEDSPLDSGIFLVDTAGGGLSDDVPAHTLTLTQEGNWELSPRGGPWTALTGGLEILELLDGDEEIPACEATYALTGEATDTPGCDTCDAVFAVTFYLSDGDPAACSDPDLPLADEVRTLGWSSVDETIYFDYFDTGVWLPWYEGVEDEDTVTFSWTTELAIYVEEDTGT